MGCSLPQFTLLEMQPYPLTLGLPHQVEGKATFEATCFSLSLNVFLQQEANSELHCLNLQNRDDPITASFGDDVEKQG